MLKLLSALAFVYAVPVLAAPDAPVALAIETRGAQICVAGAQPDRCFQNLSLGEGGLDLRAQLVKYEAVVDDQGGPKPGVKLTLNDVQGLAAGLGLAPEARRQTLRRFAKLKLRRLGADAEHMKRIVGERSADTGTEIAFLGELEWTEAAQPAEGRTTVVSGRLFIPEQQGDQKSLSDLNPTEMNAALSALVRIDGVSNPALGEDQIRGVIAPAVMANVYVAVVLPMIQQFTEALTDALGQALSEAFGGAKPAPEAPKAAPSL